MPCGHNARMDQDRAKSPEPEPLRTLPVLVRGILLVFAIFNLALGIVGIFVPGLPTTVFILLAAWAAAKSSPPLYRWLWNHRLFGPMLQNWASGGCVSRKAKWTASAVMSSSVVILLFSNAPRWATATAIACMAIVLAWLWRRPEP